jgi:putative oxidoreductase
MTTMKTSTRDLSAGGAAVLRLALGVVMLAHAAAKYFVFTLPGTAAFFVQHGFPGWTALPVFAAEAAGGLLLLAGWQARAVCIGLMPVMLGAWSVHAPNGWMFSEPNGGWEYPAFLFVALVAQALLGGGAWALQCRPPVPSAAREACD